MATGSDAQEETFRLFPEKTTGKKGGSQLSLGEEGGVVDLDILSLMGDDEELKEGTCLTLRVIQNIFTCGKKKGLWEPSQGNVFKAHEVEETKYPFILKFLEYGNICDALFVSTCLASLFLFFFSVGFLMKSKVMWGIIHVNNSLYTIGLFAQWLRILITTKYGKSNQGYTKADVVLSLVTVFPMDLIILVIYSLNKKEVETTTDNLIITGSRINYLFRIYYVSKYFSIWENQLIVSDTVMFLIRTTLYSTFMLHIFGCLWHSVACKSFAPKDFLMTPDEATDDVCEENSWINVLKRERRSPLLDHPNLNVLGIHYLVSLYWATIVGFGLGLGDIRIFLTGTTEIVMTAITQMACWIFTLTVINGTLTSLFVEGDTERDSFLTRMLAIKNYLEFTSVKKNIVQDVKKFYDYLWLRRKGIMHLESIDILPKTMRTDVFYDVHNFVFNQLPLFRDMDQGFMMNLSIHVEHTFHLAGEMLFRKNDTGDRMRYLLKGYLEILCDDESRVITNIRSGSAIGEIHLIQPFPHIANVRCGSDCDILELSKNSFKHLMNSYPEHWESFRARIQDRFDQSELLLSLCEKHNDYPRAFLKVDKKLRPFSQETYPGLKKVDVSTSSDKHLPKKKGEFRTSIPKDFDEFEGMTVHQATLRRMSTRESLYNEKDGKTKKALEEEAFKALETDVMRAGSLAKDLGIPRPPLFLTAPNSTLNRLPSQNQDPPEKVFDTTPLDFVFRISTSILALIVIWYYMFAVAYRSKETVIASGIFHIADVWFAINFFLDMRQIVVTPQKTLENGKEIFFYRMKQTSTYFRFFAFVPWEYLMTPLCQASMFNVDNPQKEFVYSCFKLNRLLMAVQIFLVFRELESMQVLSVFKLFILKFLIATVFTIHVFAVLFRLIVEYIYGWDASIQFDYEIPAYWSAQVTTATGFGDVLYTINLEVFTIVVALLLGTIVVTYFGAKNAALLANAARRRVSFKQTFYCVKSFMIQRKFPKYLINRVLDYYNMQWRAHEGTLIPTEKSVIWDTPESIHHRVNMCQAELFFDRVPLVQYCSEKAQREYSKALRQYFVPPGETVLYSDDKRRELTFIVKGFCKVKKNGAIVGTFSQGNYFGLPGLIFGTNKEFEIVTETHCLFFCLLFDDFVELAKEQHSIHRDYKILKGEAKFRIREYPLPANQLDEQGIPHLYAKVLKARDVGLRPNKKSHDRSGSNDSVMILENEAARKIERNEDLGGWKHMKWIRKLMCMKPIHPNGKFINYWTVFRTIMAVFATIIVTASSAFPFHPGVSFFVMLIFDIVSWIDIYLMLHLSYYGEEGQLITDPVMTARNYITGPFLVDFIASFPFDYFVLPFAIYGVRFFSPMKPREYIDNWAVQVMAHLRLLRSIQIYRLFLLGALIEKTIFKSLTFITLVNVVPLMYLFMHVVTCILGYYSCFWSVEINPRCPDTSLLLHFKPLNAYPHNVSNAGNPPIDIYDPLTMYIIGLYWTMQTALSVGFGDFMLYDVKFVDYYPAVNRIFAIIVIIFGSAVSLHLGSKLTACLVTEDSRRIEIRDRMKVLFDFLEQYKVSNSIQRRVRELYFNAWDKTKGISASELFVALHPALQADVTKQLYEHQLRKCPLLKDLDEAGIRMLSSKLTEVFYPEGEYIMKLGDLNSDVFIISTGIVVSYSMGGQILSYMAPGTLFGEISALFEVQRLYSAVAAMDTEIFVFKREHFLEFLNNYPDMRRAVEATCLNHYKETMEGAAQTYGVEVVISRVDSKEMINFIQDTVTDSGKVDTGVDIIKPVEKGKEVGDKAKSDVNSVNITSDQAKKHPEFIEDPLRVTLKPKVPKEDPTTTAKEKTKDKETKDEDYDDRNSSWWSFLLTFGRIPRDEMGLIHIFQEKNKCNILTFVIHPLSPITSKAFFICVALLFTCLSCSLVSFDMSFRVTRPDAGWSAEDMKMISGLEIVVEIFFLLRFLGNFNLGYVDDDGVLVTNKKAIIKRYVCKLDGLTLDLIAFPYYFPTMNYFNAPFNSYLKGFQLIRMLLFWRYLSETESELRMKASMIKIVKISIVLVFIFHFCACFWYLIACDGRICEKDSWMSGAMKKIRTDLDLQPMDPDPDLNLALRYSISIYFVSTAITFTGLNYIEISLVKEILLTMLIIFTTVFLIGFLIGEITQCLASGITGKMQYDHQLSVIQDHFTSLGLRRSKVKEVRNYYKLLWQKYRGMTASILDDIPYSLRADLMFATYGVNIKNARILGKLDETIIRQLCIRVRHEIHLPGSRIVRSGDLCDAMYFIKRGEVVILDENQNMELCIEILYENECFGEVKLLLPRGGGLQKGQEGYRFSYVARLETEVGVLYREDLEDVINNYPVLQAELAEKAKKVKVHRIAIREEEDRTKRLEMGIEPEYSIGINSGTAEEGPMEIDEPFEKARANYIRTSFSAPEGPGSAAMRQRENDGYKN